MDPAKVAELEAQSTPKDLPFDPSAPAPGANAAYEAVKDRPAAGSQEEKDKTAIANAVAGETLKPRKLAPAKEAPPGAAEAQGGAAQGVGSAPFVMGIGGGAPRAVGLSPADKELESGLKDQASRVTAGLDQAIGQNRDAVAAFKAQSDALAAESQVGAARYAEDEQLNQMKQRQLAKETQEAQQRTDSRLADLQAQGIDPNRYWQNRTTGEKIAAALLIGLGEANAHQLGPRGGGRGQNVALDQINGAIREEIDAQRTNLAKSIEVAKMRGDLEEKGFDRQAAMLRAERDSIQTAYAVAQQDVTRRMSLFKDNAAFQAQGAQLLQGLTASREKLVGDTNMDLYKLHKGAERVVGGMGQTITTVLKNGQPWSGTLGQYKELVASGLAEDQSLAGSKTRSEIIKNVASTEKANKPNAQTQAKIVALRDALENIERIKALRAKHHGGSADIEDRRRAADLATRTQEHLLAGLGTKAKAFLERQKEVMPNQPLELQWSGLLGADANGATIDETEGFARRELAALEGSSGGEAAPNENPAGGEEDTEQ